MGVHEPTLLWIKATLSAQKTHRLTASRHFCHPDAVEPTMPLNTAGKPASLQSVWELEDNIQTKQDGSETIKAAHNEELML